VIDSRLSERLISGHVCAMIICMCYIVYALIFYLLPLSLALYGLTSFPGRATGKQLFMARRIVDHCLSCSFAEWVIRIGFALAG